MQREKTIKTPRGFKKILGRWDSLAIIIAVVIGVGIFRVPAEVAKYLDSPRLILSAWLLGGVISLLGALCFAELSSSFPKTGGNYIYLRESYGPCAGFLFGWSELIAIRTGSIAAVSFICAEYARSFLSINGSLVKPLAISVVFALSFTNMAGLRYGKKIQDILTVVKIAALTGVILFGFFSGRGDLAHFSSASPLPERGLLASFGLALIPILWTYGGWHENTFVAGETKKAGKVIPFALIAGILIVMAGYLAMNFLYIYLFPVNIIANTPLIASDTLNALYGGAGKKIFEALVIISSLGCINAMIITGSRVTYAMSKDNAFFNFLGKVNPRYATPLRALGVNAVWSAVLILWGTFNDILFFTGVLVWLFFALTVAGLFILRRKFPGIERPYRMWGYPLLPAVFVIICLSLVVNTLVHYPTQSLIGLSLAAAGIPVFLLSKLKKRRHG